MYLTGLTAAADAAWLGITPLIASGAAPGEESWVAAEGLVQLELDEVSVEATLVVPEPGVRPGQCSQAAFGRLPFHGHGHFGHGLFAIRPGIWILPNGELLPDVVP